MHTVIKNPFEEKLDYRFAKGEGASADGEWIVILGHGVTGNMDRPIMTDTANALNAAGYDTLRFSFSGNGNSEGNFRQSTVSKEVEDLNSVLNAVESRYTKICYVGHSMGAAVGVLKASKDKRISALVSLAGMVNTKAFAQAEFGDETPGSGLMWEEENCPLSFTFMEDLCQVVGSVAWQIESVQAPWLLLHGTADDVVLPHDTELVEDRKGDAVTVVYIDGADHSFNEPEHKKGATSAVVGFLDNLKG